VLEENLTANGILLSCPSPAVLQQEPGAAAIPPWPQSEPGPLPGTGHDPGCCAI